MKCMRRPDRDTVARVHIAAQAFLSLGVYGEITRRAKSYRVSRLCIYKLLWPLLLLYDLDVGDPRSPEAIRKEVDRHILLLRFEGHCALERIAQILKQLGLPFASVGAISQRLAAYAQALPRETWTNARMVFLVCDEILTRGQPILITVEPCSVAILKSELGKNREAETWKHHWTTVAEAGLIEQQTVVSDQGSGLVKGCALMGRTQQPDVFHLLRPLAMCGERFDRKALAAIAREYERGSVMSGRSEGVIAKRSRAYEAAKAEAEAQIAREDNCCSLWMALRQTREVFAARGGLTALTARQAAIDALVTVMDTLDEGSLHQTLVSFTSGLEGYWSSYQRVEQVYQACMARDPRDVVQALACGWQLARQATNRKAYGTRKRLAQDAEFSFCSAATGHPDAAQALQQERLDALDTEVRSSSLIENVNSALRPLLETCRGQVGQPLLDLFAYVHNHRRFVRGKRAGKAPSEILTGKDMATPWLTSL